MAGWIHATLILAILPPLFYAVGTEQRGAVGQAFYFRCLIIAFPVVVTGIAAEKCRGVLSYLSVCVFLFAATGAMAWAISGEQYQWRKYGGYIVFLLAETLFLIIGRFAGRLHRKRAMEVMRKEDPGAEPYSEWLKEPSFTVLLFFCLVYALALNVDSPEVCNAALFSAAIYGMAALLYHYIARTEKYLTLNKRTCNLPSKRIYGIGSGALAIFLLLLLLGVLPSFLTISRRDYQDFRKRAGNRKIDFTGLEPEAGEPVVGGADMDWLNELGEIKPAPAWMETLSYVIGGAALLFPAVILTKTVFRVFREFREAGDENGDVVEELEEQETEYIWMRKQREKAGTVLSERERVRKQYRRFIRRHRKERPAPYESPAEIETRAGVAQSEEGKAMHGQYEYARYGRGAGEPEQGRESFHSLIL